MQWLKYMVSALVISVLFVSSSYCQKVLTTPSTVKLADSTQWVLIDESDWAVFMEAPSYHFNLAQNFMQKGNYKRAAEELNRGNSFLIFLKDRLAIASRAVEVLSVNTAAGKVKSIDKLALNTSIAIQAIDYKYTMIPIDVNELVILNDSYWYHFNQSKSKYLENDRMGAAMEIRKGSSYLKFKTFYTGNRDTVKVKAIIDELANLAIKVESGTVENVRELDELFQKAISSVN